MPKNEELLTDTELELMSILWEIQEGTVRDVLKRTQRDLAYTSVSTIIRILEKKGFVTSTKSGKSHIYSPVMAKVDYEKKSLNSLVENVFQGEASSLVKCLVEQEKLSTDQIEELKKILNKAGQ